MAIRQITIGSLQNFHAYDDASYSDAANFPGPIIANGAPSNINHVLRLGDITSFGLLTFAFTNLIIPPASSTLSIGTELSSAYLEYISITAAGAETLTNFLSGLNGQLKILIFGDNNVSLTDGTRDSGKFFLNQLPLTNLTGSVGDVLALLNIGGDGGVTTHGYWEELFRTVKVK